MRIYEVFCFAKDEWPPRRVGLFVARSEYEARGEAANEVKEEGLRLQFAGLVWDGPPVRVVDLTNDMIAAKNVEVKAVADNANPEHIVGRAAADA